MDKRFVVRKTIHPNVYKIKDTKLGYAIETVHGLNKAKRRAAYLNKQKEASA